VRDERGRSGRPETLGRALDRVREQLAPKTPLAEVQRVWDGTVGPRIAAVTEVVAERDGTVTIECASAVWAQELELMATQLLARLDRELGGSGPRELRFRSSA
jgi:predicted nucleic acid-binding Zn ribbon protein